MRRANTDYKFNEENINIHYLSTHSLKSNYGSDTHTQTNLEFDYYFNRLCHIDDHDICHKTILGNTYESGIGSSISSIDMHSNLSCTTEELSSTSMDVEPVISTANCYNLCSHFDSHDLPPVTEEEDNDSLLGIFNNSENDNKHLDTLPWHDNYITFKPRKHTYQSIFNRSIEAVHSKDTESYSHWWDYYKVNHDDNCVLFFPLDTCENCIEKPWISDTASFNPVLSSICHKSDDCLLKSKKFLSHLTHTNMISDKAIMYKVFQRRHSIKNGPSIFTYNINSLMTMDGHESNFEDDEFLQGSLSD